MKILSIIVECNYIVHAGTVNGHALHPTASSRGSIISSFPVSLLFLNVHSPPMYHETTQHRLNIDVK